jgi:hypothetical protein
MWGGLPARSRPPGGSCFQRPKSLLVAGCGLVARPTRPTKKGRVPKHSPDLIERMATSCEEPEAPDALRRLLGHVRHHRPERLLLLRHRREHLRGPLRFAPRVWERHHRQESRLGRRQSTGNLLERRRSTGCCCAKSPGYRYELRQWMGCCCAMSTDCRYGLRQWTGCCYATAIRRSSRHQSMESCCATESRSLRHLPVSRCATAFRPSRRLRENRCATKIRFSSRPRENRCAMASQHGRPEMRHAMPARRRGSPLEHRARRR